MIEKLLSEGGLSLDRLKNFCLVAEYGGIARASGGDPSRQALISRQIGELESFFGVELTRRKGKGLELTEAGGELARQIRLQFQALADFKSTHAAQPIRFRLAGGASVMEWLLTPCLAPLVEQWPDSTFELFDWRTADVVRGLLEHTVDFGIIRKSGVVRPLKSRLLGGFGYSLFVPVKRGRGEWHDLETLPLAVSVGGEFLRELHDAAAKAKFPLRVTYHCASFTQAAQLVRAGTAAAILPDFAAPSFAGTVRRQSLPWFKAARRDLCLVWHPRLLASRPRVKQVEAVLGGLLEKVLK